MTLELVSSTDTKNVYVNTDMIAYVEEFSDSDPKKYKYYFIGGMTATTDTPIAELPTLSNE